MHKVDPQEINKKTNPASRYETRDLDVAAIFKSSSLFFGFLTLMVIVVIPIYILVANWHGGVDSVSNVKPLLPAEPNPLLQSGETAHMDIIELRKKEIAAQSSFGWEDEAKGFAHIPIERAIQLTARRGLQPLQGGSESP